MIQNFEDGPEFCSRITRGFGGRVGSLSTRFSEDQELVVCGQEEKLDDNSRSIAVQNFGVSDATKGVCPWL